MIVAGLCAIVLDRFDVFRELVLFGSYFPILNMCNVMMMHMMDFLWFFMLFHLPVFLCWVIIIQQTEGLLLSRRFGIFLWHA